MLASSPSSSFQRSPSSESFMSLIGSSSTSTSFLMMNAYHGPLSAISCAQEAAWSEWSTFDWSDIPVQGDVPAMNWSDQEETFSAQGPAIGSASPEPRPLVYSSSSSSFDDEDHEEDLDSLNLHWPVSMSATRKSNLARAASSSSSTSSPCLKKMKRKFVSFDKCVQVRTLPVELGDHPWCRGGMALTCGWSLDESDPACLDLDVHEQARRPRSLEDLRLSLAQRIDRLQEATGLTLAQLQQQEYELMCSPPTTTASSSSS